MKSTLFILIMFLGSFSFMYAQANLSVQGTIQKSTGVSVEDGEYSLTFKLYTTETGGSPVWSETQPDVNVIGGVYSVTLGSVNPLTAAFDKPYFLGITIGSATELTPRAVLTSSPYALSLIGQDNVFPSTGSVGVGTNSPAAGYKLHVNNASGQGKLLLEGTTGSVLNFKKDTETAIMGLTSNSDNIFRLLPGNNMTQFYYGNSPKFFVDSYGTWTEGDANVHGVNSGRMTVRSDKNASVAAALDNGSSWITLEANESTHSAVAAKNDLNLWAGSNGANFKLWSGGAYLNRVLTIAANQTYFINSYFKFTDPWNNYVTVWSGNSYPSLILEGEMVANAINLRSDRRIKKDMKPSVAGKDIAVLMGLKVTDYHLIDSLALGNGDKKGFVAQEVEEVFPQAVASESDFTPDIYVATTKIAKEGELLKFELDKEHHLSEGDEVKLYVKSGSTEAVKVAKLISDKAFSVEWSKPVPEWAFVYGKMVKDIRRVDYDQIHNLNVSVTQELVRRVEQLERENAGLRTENSGIRKQYEHIQSVNTNLQSDFNMLSERILKLEKRSDAGINK